MAQRSFRQANEARGDVDQSLGVQRRIRLHAGSVRVFVLPDDLAVFDLQARHIAPHPLDIEPFAIDRRCARRPLSSLRGLLPKGLSQWCYPDVTSVLLGQGPDDFLIAAIAHDEDPSGGD